MPNDSGSRYLTAREVFSAFEHGFGLPADGPAIQLEGRNDYIRVSTVYCAPDLNAEHFSGAKPIGTANGDENALLRLQLQYVRQQLHDSKDITALTILAPIYIPAQEVLDEINKPVAERNTSTLETPGHFMAGVWVQSEVNANVVAQFNNEVGKDHILNKSDDILLNHAPFVGALKALFSQSHFHVFESTESPALIESHHDNVNKAAQSAGAELHISTPTQQQDNDCGVWTIAHSLSHLQSNTSVEIADRTKREAFARKSRELYAAIAKGGDDASRQAAIEAAKTEHLAELASHNYTTSDYSFNLRPKQRPLLTNAGSEFDEIEAAAEEAGYRLYIYGQKGDADYRVEGKISGAKITCTADGMINLSKFDVAAVKFAAEQFARRLEGEESKEIEATFAPDDLKHKPQLVAIFKEKGITIVDKSAPKADKGQPDMEQLQRLLTQTNRQAGGANPTSGPQRSAPGPGPAATAA